METTTREKLLARINRKDWWHVPPADPTAYRKRGKFLASTFREAEFWGRPLDTPTRVHIRNPVIGDEPAIETELLGAPSECPKGHSSEIVKWRHEVDAKLKQAALDKGYDSIVLMSPNAYARFKNEGRIPISLELNLLGRDLEMPDKSERKQRSR